MSSEPQILYHFVKKSSTFVKKTPASFRPAVEAGSLRVLTWWQSAAWAFTAPLLSRLFSEAQLAVVHRREAASSSVNSGSYRQFTCVAPLTYHISEIFRSPKWNGRGFMSYMLLPWIPKPAYRP